MDQKQKTMTAAQRLEGLEQAFALTDQTLGNLAMNLQTAINALTLLSKKLEAVIRLGNSGKAINSANVAAEIVDMNAEQLEKKVEDLKAQGVLAAGEVIQENSFIVGRELNPETKEVVEKRAQYPMFGLKPEAKESFLGKKVGDVVTVKEGRNLFEITEVYNLVVPSAPVAKVSEESSEDSSAQSSEQSSQEASTEESSEQGNDGTSA